MTNVLVGYLPHHAPLQQRPISYSVAHLKNRLCIASKKRFAPYGAVKYGQGHSRSRSTSGSQVQRSPSDDISEASTSGKDSSSEGNGAIALESNPVSQVVSAVKVSGWRRRFTIVGLCFVAFMLCNMDRVNMSIAILPMSKQYGWDSATIGLVQSSFFWGYLTTQVAGGVWADKYGGKTVLGFGVIWWSIATALTPLAASLGLPTLLFARACMGVGEGVAMPAMNNLLSRWVPVQERSRSLALVYSGMYTGSVLGLAAAPHLIEWLTWPSVFHIFGSIGVLWFLLWEWQATSSPLEDSRCSPEEKELLAANTPASRPRGEPIPWKLLLSKAPVWALIISHFCHNWGTFILLTWMPMYYNQVLGFDLLKSGIFSVLPWITMAVFANVGGWLADTMVSKGVSVTRVRKIMQTIGFMGPAIFLTRLGSVSTPMGAVACMMASQGLDSFSQSGLYSNHQDIGPRYSGVLLGMSNTAGVLAGVLGTAATGLILANGSWDDVWGVAVALYLVGTVVWNVFSTGEQIFD
ncbi:hypothetical protein WJX75_004949 [Coccomyxa subellipsoidea]|uniref:Major facilitator superfamily (MFS) profile domain-containing protein n=1 Tax=Coccomyxa subellipsoidea TaxID=248742 RepID=A0ABR2YKE7_9CHLO